MMKRIDAFAWEVVPSRPGGWDLDLQGRDCLVDVEVVGTDEVILSGVDLHGEVKGLDRGPMIKLRAHVSGFRGLNLASPGTMSIKATWSDGAEFVDPVPLVVSEAAPADPVRVAMAEQMRRFLMAQEAERRLSDEEIEELVDNFVNPDLEFEEGLDDWGLPAAAAELEEQAAEARAAAQAEFDRQREEALREADSVPGGPENPPGEQPLTAPEAPSPAPAEGAPPRKNAAKR